ncbi:MAG: epimerase [Deltaproteobacteria bacterium RBG_13_61_14]|nr:MAG: epimerase [Deltaproteobacteria bacterium RBG_13_61_14]
MTETELSVVTGAFSYLGRYITSRLLEQGVRVRTLTGHPDRPHPFGDQVEAFPFDFEQPELLVSHLRGATTLYNTYWIRFPHGPLTYDRAVANTQLLFQAAKTAGVQRVVHISITNPSEDSPFPYFRGKAVLERSLQECGLSYAILRPTILFGKEDILINNIAWLLRRFPVFGIFGSGKYEVQPVYVDDVAALAIELAEKQENLVKDAVGPQVYTFENLVRIICRELGRRTRLLHLPPLLGLLAGYFFRPLLRDVLITRDEIGGLIAGLLVSRNNPTCPTRFSPWLRDHVHELGRGYASELLRHYR